MAGRGSSGAGSARLGEGALVILPCYEEAATLASVIARLHATAPAAGVLVIDDASPDGTGAIADAIAAEDPSVEVLHRPAKLGLGTAYAAGFRLALEQGFDCVVEMDADGSHLPEELPALLSALGDGAGMALGARWIEGGRIEGWPWHRRWVSRTGTRIARLALRSRLRDITSGFRAIDAEWIARLPLDAMAAQGYGFQVEVAWGLERLGCRIVEVPITFVERRAGRSKMSVGIVAEALRLVLLWGWRLRFGRGPQSADSEITP